MPEDNPNPPAATPATTSAPPPTAAKPNTGPTITIGDEFGTEKKSLPPAKIVLSAIGGVLVIVAIYSFVGRAKPQGSGSLDNFIAAEIQGQDSTMVALTFTL